MTEDVPAGRAGRCGVVVERMYLMGHWVQNTHDVVRAGSRWTRVVAGTPRVPSHCRVPYWQVASP